MATDPKQDDSWEASILHVDMDAFFAAVEQRSEPRLRGIPMYVAHPSGRSVVLSASYEARAQGVRSAMPVARAMQLSPHSVVVPPRHELYYEVSAQIMEIFASFTHLVEQISVDEAFLDVGGAKRRLGSPLVIARTIRSSIARELNLTASVGVARNKFVAKVASTRSKPNGLLVIPASETVAFMHTLPVSAVWGVGEKTRSVLEGMGITTVEQLAHTPVAKLQAALGIMGAKIRSLAWGEDDRPVETERSEKSFGAEETFGVDVWQTEELNRELLRLAHRVAQRLRTAGFRSRTISIKLRYADFSTLTRSKTLHVGSDNAREIFNLASTLLAALGERRQAVRLIGLRAENLELASAPKQLRFDDESENWLSAEKTMDAVGAKYGSGTIAPARLLPGPQRQGT